MIAISEWFSFRFIIYYKININDKIKTKPNSKI